MRSSQILGAVTACGHSFFFLNNKQVYMQTILAVIEGSVIALFLQDVTALTEETIIIVSLH